MTGQGDKNYDLIKKSKPQKGVLDVSKNFTTINGCLVRKLRVEKTNKVVIGGKVITAAHTRFIITGQVLVKNQWLPAEWDANGRHSQEQYSLMEVKEQTKQGNLF